MELQTNQVWYNKEGRRNYRGTQELVEFVMKAYQCLIEEENKILGEAQYNQSASSFQVFCRVDVCLVWDTQTNKYCYTVNGVQGGMAGLFGLGQEASAVIARAVVDGIGAGSMEG